MTTRPRVDTPKWPTAFHGWKRLSRRRNPSRLQRPKTAAGSPALGLASHARDVALFVAVCAIFIDLLLLAVALSAGQGIGQAAESSVMSMWALGKAGLAVAGLAFLAIKGRTGSWVPFAVVLAVVAIEDQIFLHGRMGARLARTIDLEGLRSLVPAPEESWGQLLVLTVLGAIGAAIAIMGVLRTAPQLRTVMWFYTGFLVVLFLFAGVVDLLADAYPQGSLPTIEELGEQLSLSLIFGYTTGVVASASARR